jgi:hypothetical protein
MVAFPFGCNWGAIAVARCGSHARCGLAYRRKWHWIASSSRRGHYATRFAELWISAFKVQSPRLVTCAAVRHSYSTPDFHSPVLHACPCG